MSEIGPRVGEMIRIELTGLDGAGKTSVAENLARTFGIEHRRFEAFDQPLEQKVRRIQLGLGHPAAMAARGAAIAVGLLDEAARPVTQSVVRDRYVESARMFWSVVGSAPVPTDVLALIPPNDAVILLDVPLDVAVARQKQSRFSDKGTERAYLAACLEYLRSTADREGWLVVDARAPLLETCETVARQLDLSERLTSVDERGSGTDARH